MNNRVMKGRNEGERAMMAGKKIESVIHPGVNKFYYLNGDLGKEEACQSGCLVISFP